MMYSYDGNNYILYSDADTAVLLQDNVTDKTHRNADACASRQHL